MTKKIFLLVLGLILGIIIYNSFGLILYLGFLFFVLLFSVKENKLFYFLLGSLLLTIPIMLIDKPDLELNNGDRFLLNGEVIKINKNDENYQKVIIKSTDGYKFSTSIYNQNKLQLYDNVTGVLTIREGNNLKNFNLYNKEDYNFVNNIESEGYLEIENINKTNSIFKILKRNFTDYVINTVNRYLDEENSGVILKLILARSDNLNESIEDKYRDGGLSHLLAISGLHIFIIIFVLDQILISFNLNFNLRTIVIITILFLYGFFIDFPSSMVRALLMFSTKRILEINRIPISNISAIFLSAIVILVLNPRKLYDLGFQLSYLSVLGINLLYGKVLPKGKNNISNSVYLYLSVNIFILPILVYKFNNFNVFSLFSNLVITPLFTIVLILSYFGLLFGKIFLIGNYIFIAVNFILNYINSFLDLFLNYFNLFFSIKYPNLFLIFIYYITLFLIIKKPRLNFSKNIIYSVLTAIFSIYIVFAIQLNENNLYLGFYDVGQGDSIYLAYNDIYIQVDTGGSTSPYFNPGEDITAKAIKQRGIKKIRYLILTHFDYDHIGGAEKLIELGLVDSLIINKPEKENPIYKSMKANKDIKIFYPTGEEPLVINDQLKIYFLNTGVKFSDKNDSSIVLFIEFKDKKILLTGDVSSKIESELVNKLGKIDILKVAHHGSKDSTSLDFLYNIRPEYGIISVGKNNYGHPHPNVLKNLERVNTKIIRTDKSGEILFKIGNDIKFITYEDKGVFYNYIYEIVFSGIILLMLAYYVSKESHCNEIYRF